ncbi:MAG: DUF2219 family protein [Gammaproteobacteria bacterium]|nr:DUF2219 family protein [Gammaproteobacteria bacterium]
MSTVGLRRFRRETAGPLVAAVILFAIGIGMPDGSSGSEIQVPYGQSGMTTEGETQSGIRVANSTGLSGALPTLAETEETGFLGFAWSHSNDSLGDWHDRWRSSSSEAGILTGPAGMDQAPPRLGQLMEYRFRSDILMPANVRSPHPGDRRHAGMVAFGLHSHARRRNLDLRVGGELVVIGPQTGLYDIQTRLHRILGFDIPNLPDFQIGNTVRLEASAEAGAILRSRGWTIRPFVELRSGTEDIFRLGIDLKSGSGPDDLAMRAVATGHRVPFGLIRRAGLHYVAGADVAWVGESIYLPESLGYRLTPVRVRLRGGIQYTGRRFDLFYGLSWLGKEFEAQPEGQFVGTLQFKIRF